MVLASIPSPAQAVWHLGPIPIRAYALAIILGIVIAWWWMDRRYRAKGGPDEVSIDVAMWAVFFGILGGRLYHVITDYQLYFGPGRNPWQAFNIRSGGLGIWGGVMLGAFAAWLLARRYRFSFGELADVIAPGLLFAQSLGRLGNWFNQELFGRPTDLPWALYVEPRYRPTGYESYSTYHPTFLYEMVWTGLGGFVLLWVERRFKLGRGKLFTCYVIWYTFGRFFIESLRIDPVNQVGGWRVNSYVSLILFAGAVALLIWQLRRRPGYQLWSFGFAKPQGHLVPARPR